MQDTSCGRAHRLVARLTSDEYVGADLNALLPKLHQLRSYATQDRANERVLSPHVRVTPGETWPRCTEEVTRRDLTASMTVPRDAGWKT